MQLPPLESLNYLDFAIGGILLFFAARGLLRGIISELSGLVAFVAAIFIAGNSHLHSFSVRFLDKILGDPAWSSLFSYLLLFGAGFSLITYAGRLLQRSLSACVTAWPGHVGGFFAGLAKGYVICTLLLIFMQYAGLGAQMRQHSILVPHINDSWVAISRITNDFQHLPDFSGNKLTLDNLESYLPDLR